MGIFSCLILIQIVRLTPVLNGFLPLAFDNVLPVTEVVGDQYLPFYDEFQYFSMGTLGLFPYLFAMLTAQFSLFYLIQVEKETNQVKLKKKISQFGNYCILFGTLFFSSDYLLEHINYKPFIQSFSYWFLKEELVVLISIVIGCLIIVFVIREITRERWGSGISVLLSFDGTASVFTMPINLVSMSVLQNNVNFELLLKKSFLSQNLQNLFFYFGFLILLNVLNKVYMYLPYKACEFENLQSSTLVSRENLNSYTRCIPLRVNIIGIGTFIFVLDAVLETICYPSLNIYFEIVEGGFVCEVYDLFLNFIGTFILILLVVLASGSLYIQRLNFMQIASIIESNFFVISKYVKGKWAFMSTCDVLYLEQAAWNKGITKVTFYIAFIICSSCLLTSLMSSFRDLNWSILIILGGSINDVITNVTDFYGNREIV